VGTILIDVDDAGDMNAYLAQLERLAERAPSRLLPAHGDPIDDSVARLRFYIRHRLAREARVLDAVRRDPTSLDDVAREAYADTPAAPRVLAERSARAHLQRLEVLGQVRHTDGRWCRCD
jgi:glyoxylase-like metal-dependent hydrolase (beta-lactamase superfamily II)